GLPFFYFKPLTLLKKERQILFIPDHTLKKEKKDAIYIRIIWGGVRVGVTAAVVAAFVFLVSTPVKNVNPLMYTASFVPVELSVSKLENEVSAGVTDEKIIRFSGETVDTLSDVLEQEVRTVVPKTGKTYYIVIGSFPNETLSEKFMNQIDRGLSPNAGYVRKGDKVRVYSDKFDNREDAEAYLSQLRQTGKHSDAWLFISR
ncbi:MAG: SPOR domain-containing protein, partial [Massilibacteroides sp.]|nr:SPOR domain-containing protein [Massilibacteroides sp.]